MNPCLNLRLRRRWRVVDAAVTRLRNWFRRWLLRFLRAWVAWLEDAIPEPETPGRVAVRFEWKDGRCDRKRLFAHSLAPDLPRDGRVFRSAGIGRHGEHVYREVVNRG